jgi:glycosyltransferase involved in cell wall biosynthesis
MTRVLAIHLNDTLALPTEDDPTGEVRRRINYKKYLDYYGIITKSLQTKPRQHQSPAPNMDVWPTNSRNKYFFLKDVYRMACQVIPEKKIEIVTTQDPAWLGLLGVLLKQKHKIKLNLQCHLEFLNNPYFKQESFRFYIEYLLSQKNLSLADSIYVGTTREKQDIVKFGIPEDRVFQIPYAVPLENFAEADGTEIRNELNALGFDSVLLWVGRMVKQKDIKTLLTAFKQVCESVKNVGLVLIGQGSELQNIKADVEELGIEKQVLLTGYVEYDKCPLYYAAADIICISSLYEGTCRILHEAMAAGKPVVTTEFAGALDAVLPGETGYIVPFKDAEAMAKAILDLLSDREKRQALGYQAKEHIFAHFPNVDEHCKQVAQMWQITTNL